MEIKKCTQADYAALLDVFNDAFGYGRTNEWFQKNMPHCTPYPAQAKADEVERHFMCIIDGCIVGGLGAYPLDWVVSNASGERRVISAYGIGQVCCLPEFRNHGVMSALMKASEAEMYKQCRTVGYLGGDRRRYKHFGYDFGICNVSYRLDVELLKLVANPGVAIREASLADWPVINEAYETLPSYIKRSPRGWELRFLRTAISGL